MLELQIDTNREKISGYLWKNFEHQSTWSNFPIYFHVFLPFFPFFLFPRGLSLMFLSHPASPNNVFSCFSLLQDLGDLMWLDKIFTKIREYTWYLRPGSGRGRRDWAFWSLSCSLESSVMRRAWTWAFLTIIMRILLVQFTSAKSSSVATGNLC